MQKLKVTSRRLQIVVLVFMALTPCAVALSVIMQTWAQLLHLPQGITLDAGKITGVALLVVVLLGLIKPVVYLVAFRHLYKLLGLYRNGIVFTAENVAVIRHIGWAIAAIDIAGMIQTLMTGPILTYFQISSGYLAARLEAGYLIIGLFVVVIAYVMDMGRELKEQDNLVI